MLSISFQFLPCYLGWLQIAALCTVRGRAEHHGVDPGTRETLFLPFHSFLCRLCRPCKDICTSIDSLVWEGNPVLEAFKKSRLETHP